MSKVNWVSSSREHWQIRKTGNSIIILLLKLCYMFTYSKHDHILPYSNNDHALLVHTSRKPTIDDWEECVIKLKVSEEPEHHNLISLSLQTPKIGGKSVKMSECQWEQVKLYMSQKTYFLLYRRANSRKAWCPLQQN